MAEQKIIRETCVAGRMIDHIIKLPTGNHRGRRGKRVNPSSEKVQKNNDRIAERNLRRLLAANFGYGSGHFTLTYGDKAPSNIQAKKDLECFLKKLRRDLRKEDIELKYIAVTEYENHRIHHHLVINTVNVKAVNDLWSKGWIKMSALDKTGNYCRLASYLIKETQKTFRTEESAHKRRYSTSRNLVKPIVKREFVSGAELFDDPKPMPGYYIDQDSVRRYEHPFTKVEHLEYVEIALDTPGKYKVWPRGKKVKAESQRTIRNDQLDLFEEF